MVNPFIEIEGIKIGENYPPLIIPEIGINHGGKLETAIKMVDSAKKAGAKIIKHQTHIPDDEMSEEAKKVKPGNSSSDIYSIINKCSLSEENEFKLYAYVKSKKMIFLSTPFSKKAVDRLIKFKVNAFKIGSGEFNNLPLLKYVCKFKKPLILSTGMHDIKSVKLINSYLSRLGVKYAFLHTTSLYPTPDHLVRLNAITELKKNFPKIVVGYSDHTLCETACFSAISIGASIIERHFTDHRKRRGPDIICSMDHKGLKNLIEKSTKIFNQKKGNKSYLTEEKVTRKFAFVSVVSERTIKKGERLTRNNLWVRKPGTGDFSGKDLKFLYGKKSLKDIRKNTQIKKHHIS